MNIKDELGELTLESCESIAKSLKIFLHVDGMDFKDAQSLRSQVI